MSFVPTNLNDFIINKDIAQYLKTIDEHTLNHIIFTGVHNSGKKILCYSLMKHIFDDDPYKKVFGTYDLKIGNNQVEIKYMYTPSFYEINLYEYGLYDRNIITDFIFDLISYKPINGRKRVIILNHFDKISIDAQTSLRKMLDKCVEHTIFILIVNNVSKLDKGLVSRFYIIRVPYPNDDIIKSYILSVLSDEASKRKSLIYKLLITQSNNNIYKINLLLDLYATNKALPQSTLKNNYLTKLYALIEKPNLESVMECRSILYDLVLLNIPLIEVLKSIINYYSFESNKIKDQYELIRFSAELENRMSKIEHDIIALEYLILKVKKCLFN